MIYSSEMIKKKNNKRAKINRIYKFISFPFVILTLLLALYVGYSKFIKKENDMSILGFRQYIVMTGSMEPKYNAGDLVIIKERKKEDIKIGDVINYTSENGKDTITHRVTGIIEKEGQTLYRTKGDKNNSEDPNLVNYNKVHGVLLFKVSKMGTIITKLVTGTGMAVIFVFVVLSYIRASRQEEKKIAREEIRKLYNVPKYEEEDAI